MLKACVSLASILLLLFTACGGGGHSSNDNGSGGSGGNPPPPAAASAYTVTAWSELGMHCIDGKDYSIFSILPPYNVLHAQVLQRAEPPILVTSGVTVTYEAIADPNGSINASSSDKTNFWTYVRALFQTSPAPDTGLAGTPVQSTTPHAMMFQSSLGVWEALGIPTVPYDDAGNRNPYPMVRVVVRNSQGAVLASTTAVLSVSDEITCSACHASGGSAAAQPVGGWENNPDPAKDVKFNILRKHDDRWPIAGYLAQLSAAGYVYQSSLYATAKSGTPVLCAACHATNALGAAGVSGVRPVTSAMHTLHGGVINPTTGTSLDSATTPFASCYLCHPGAQTKCQRGAMNKVACYDCHGNLTMVGAPARQGWLDLPSCQMCHNNGMRYPTTFDSNGVWRSTSDMRFATTPDKPSAGKSLYRYSSGHGGVYCAACHGSPHAEYPTLQANDNLYSAGIQGYPGKLVECTVCHTAVPSTQTGGPHGIHTIGQSWVDRHGNSAGTANASQCAYCHGANYTGSPLSALPTARTFSAGDFGTKSFAAGHQVSCYDCHNGPGGGD